jgi:hypothetical protein
LKGACLSILTLSSFTTTLGELFALLSEAEPHGVEGGKPRDFRQGNLSFN